MAIKDYDPKDYIILIITVTISVILFIIFVDVIINKVKIDGENSNLISHVVTSLVAIISIYIGHSLSKNDK